MLIMFEIDTAQPLTEQEEKILAALTSTTAPAVEAPKQRRTRKAAEPTPEPEPEPEPEASEEAPVAEDTGPTMDDAVQRATELVGANQSAAVKAALAKLGVKRVKELDSPDKIAAFMKALP